MMNPKDGPENTNPLGAWQTLEGGFGTKLAVKDNHTVAADPLEAFYWEGNRLAGSLVSEVPQYGYPRWGKDRLYWGSLTLDLSTGKQWNAEGMAAALTEGTGATVIPSPAGRYQATACAWPVDGKDFLVAASWSGGNSAYPARVLLLDHSGALKSVLWEAADLAPEALWAGEEWMVSGTMEPKVYDRKGRLIAVLDGIAPASRLEASEDGRWLLVGDYGRIAVWNTSGWEKTGEMEGPWLDYSISPDGRSVMGLDMEGNLCLMALNNNGLGQVGRIVPPLPLQAIALGKDRIVAATSVENLILTASLKEISKEKQ